MAWLGIEGHDDVRDFFAQVLAQQRLAHAYLFLGPAGVGKRRFAQALAQTLQCRGSEPPAMAPCGECDECRQVLSGTHPDVIEVAKPEDRLEFPIDTVRDEVIKPLGLKPATGRYKIVIVDDADTFSLAAANCLLKTLEEPPDRSLLILVATSPDLLLPTIRSRCQHVWFRRLTQEVVEKVLLANRWVESEEQARFCAALAEGSVSEARLLASEHVQTIRRKLLEAFGAKKPSAAALLSVVDDCFEMAGGSAAERRQVATVLLRLATHLFRQAYRVATGATSGPTEPALQALARQTDPDRLLRIIDRTVVAAEQNERRAHVVLLLEAWACAVADILNPPALQPR